MTMIFLFPSQYMLGFAVLFLMGRQNIHMPIGPSWTPILLPLALAYGLCIIDALFRFIKE